ncbi:hypothetical protein CF327_g4945 [Tilletia walkeri]|nr:hypothetical protein CF327_g4945 [Tilletia walkeri]
MGPVCCCLCVLRRLESIASTRVVQATPRERRKQVIVDVLIGLGVPILFTGLHIVNQGHRFDIVEGVGCLPTVYWTPMTVVLNMLPPLLVSVIAVIYGLLALRWFLIRRHQFNAVLQATCSHIDRSRYLRLMAMASTEAFVSFPINLATFVNRFQYQHALNPWISWADTHYDFGNILQFPAAYYEDSAEHRQVWRTVELGRWGVVVGSFLVFCFFGTSKEAVDAYMSLPRLILRSVRQNSSKAERFDDTQPAPIVAIQTAWEIESGSRRDRADISDEDLREYKSTLSDNEKV